ncbi:TetR/AcrR family transcriptional regulator [Microbacterium sp. USHLN272]|uniref:TetR/AcrR family transcriptional regulator n=1 Tax=Microbacterium sp. USHLN272 TaxID=3081287 RepID=UPI003FA5448B
MGRSEVLNQNARTRTRAKILLSAITLFSETGYSSTTIAAIAADAGVAKGLVNYYFGSKDGLLLAVVDRWHESRGSGIEPNMPDGELLAAFIDTALLPLDSALPLERVVLAARFEPATRGIFEASESRHRSSVERIDSLGRAVFARRGEADPSLAYSMMRTLLEGVVMECVVSGAKYSVEGARRWIFDMYGISDPAAERALKSSRGHGSRQAET